MNSTFKRTTGQQAIHLLPVKGRLLLLTILLFTGLSSLPAWAEMSIQYANVLGQGGAGTAAVNGAKLVRSENGLVVSVRIPTPAPNSYNYPPANPFNPAAVPGKPEAFTLWAFVFNYPDSCATPGHCVPSDIPNPDVATAVFNVAGHFVAGPVLQLNGNITFNTEQFDLNPLLEPETAEVHLAIAPHGALQSGALPNQIKTPIGNPSYWWPALFLAD